MINTGNLLQPLGWLHVSGLGSSAHRWLSAARAWSNKRRQAAEDRTAHLHDSLLDLDARTLRDIGAPAVMLARALGRRQAQRDRHDDLRAGGAAGDWRGW
ncbi:MAG: hypothetical protein ABI433_13360 [Burkholderiaceae bacterium]